MRSSSFDGRRDVLRNPSTNGGVHCSDDHRRDRDERDPAVVHPQNRQREREREAEVFRCSVVANPVSRAKPSPTGVTVDRQRIRSLLRAEFLARADNVDDRVESERDGADRQGDRDR